MHLVKLKKLLMVAITTHVKQHCYITLVTSNYIIKSRRNNTTDSLVKFLLRESYFERNSNPMNFYLFLSFEIKYMKILIVFQELNISIHQNIQL